VAVSPKQELIWEGRLHLGDEPGIYGDAAYTGLCAEHPFTVFRSDPAAQEFKVVLATANLETFTGFPGHEITIFGYEPDPAQPGHSIRQVVATARFTSADDNNKQVTVNVGTNPGPFRLSAQLRIDTTVNPGLYDDFIWRRLSLKVKDFAFFASFGFSP
jgi:hypothetical protein